MTRKDKGRGSPRSGSGSGKRAPGQKRRQSGRGTRFSLKARVMLVAAVVLAGVAIALFALARSSPDSRSGATTSSGVLQVLEQEIDFGRVPLGRRVEHGFEIRNVGTDPLTLGEPSVERLEGCCAMDAVVGSRVLKPWATTRVTVSMMMHEGMGGYHVFEVTVPTSDPAHRAVVFTVKADYA